MEDDQTDPEYNLLIAMERAFRGPEYKCVKKTDWQPHMKRVLQCVRENDPMIAELKRVIATMQFQLDAAIKNLHHIHTPDCHAHGCRFTNSEPAR